MKWSEHRSGVPGNRKSNSISERGKLCTFESQIRIMQLDTREFQFRRHCHPSSFNTFQNNVSAFLCAPIHLLIRLSKNRFHSAEFSDSDHSIQEAKATLVWAHWWIAGHETASPTASVRDLRVHAASESVVKIHKVVSKQSKITDHTHRFTNPTFDQTALITIHVYSSFYRRRLLSKMYDNHNSSFEIRGCGDVMLSATLHTDAFSSQPQTRPRLWLCEL